MRRIAALGLLVPGVFVLALLLRSDVPEKQATPFSHASSAESQDAINERSIQQLSRLIVMHPNRRVAQDLTQLIVTGKIRVNFQNFPGLEHTTLAMFMLMEEKETKELLPCFHFNPLVLCDSTMADKAKQLTILHEYTHFEQYRSGTVPPEHFTLWSRKSLAEGDTLDIRIHFESELEAYLVEIKAAEQMGCTHLLGYYPAYQKGGVPGFRRELARWMTDLHDYGPNKASMFACAANPISLEALHHAPSR